MLGAIAGVGPFFWFKGSVRRWPLPGRAGRVPAASRLAIAYAGDMQIELICQDNDDPGVFRDLFGPGEFGLHHMAMICKTTRPSVTPTSRRGRSWPGKGDRDEPHLLGRHFPYSRLHDRTVGAERDRARPGSRNMREAAETWDGTNPIVGLS